MVCNPRLWHASHLCSIADLNREEILDILDRSRAFRKADCVLGLFFFQSSTRTRLGFHAAAARLGAAVITLGEMRYEDGMTQAEAPYDAFRSVASYCDLIVLRHQEEDEFRRMVAVSPAPVINGGCGTRHHPTQALTDLFHIRSRLGRLEFLRVGIAGDLSNSRAARSLLESMMHFKVSEVRLMCPPERQVVLPNLDAYPAEQVRQLDYLDLTGLDVLYMAGYPEGSGPERSLREERWRFRLTRERAQELPEAALILDPLPRIDEIEPEIDSLPQATYFNQSQDGLFVRMAVLEWIKCHQPTETSLAPATRTTQEHLR